MSFDLGNAAETGCEKPAAEYQEIMKRLDGLAVAVNQITDDQRPEAVASAVEFVLEGLHLNRKLNCQRTPMGYLYNK
jgi:magnesium chelatase subunit I